MTTEKTMFNAEQKWRYILKKESEVTLAPGFLQNLFVKAAPLTREPKITKTFNRIGFL